MLTFEAAPRSPITWKPSSAAGMTSTPQDGSVEETVAYLLKFLTRRKCRNRIP